MRVLLVDDEPTLMELWRSFLEGEGHEVQVASSIAAATEAIGASWADVVVLDYELADGTIEPVVASAPRGAGRPGLVLASGLGAEVGDDLLAAVDVVLPKPLRLRQLRAALEAARPQR